MFTNRYFNLRYFATRYFPKVGAVLGLGSVDVDQLTLVSLTEKPSLESRTTSLTIA